MKLEWIILMSVWAVTIVLIFIIPHHKKRLAQAAFLFKQALTWFLGLVVVEWGWIRYPVRCFPDATRASFTFEFLVYPVVCAVFNSYFPEKRSVVVKLLYYAVYCTALTAVEVILEKNTELIQYVHWSWYWSWITLFVTFLMSRVFCKWFFKQRFVEEGG